MTERLYQAAGGALTAKRAPAGQLHLASLLIAKKQGRRRPDASVASVRYTALYADDPRYRDLYVVRTRSVTGRVRFSRSNTASSASRLIAPSRNDAKASEAASRLARSTGIRHPDHVCQIGSIARCQGRHFTRSRDDSGLLLRLLPIPSTRSRKVGPDSFQDRVGNLEKSLTAATGDRDFERSRVGQNPCPRFRLSPYRRAEARDFDDFGNRPDGANAIDQFDDAEEHTGCQFCPRRQSHSELGFPAGGMELVTRRRLARMDQERTAIDAFAIADSRRSSRRSGSPTPTVDGSSARTSLAFLFFVKSSVQRGRVVVSVRGRVALSLIDRTGKGFTRSLKVDKKPTPADLDDSGRNRLDRSREDHVAFGARHSIHLWGVCRLRRRILWGRFCVRFEKLSVVPLSEVRSIARRVRRGQSGLRAGASRLPVRRLRDAPRAGRIAGRRSVDVHRQGRSGVRPDRPERTADTRRVKDRATGEPGRGFDYFRFTVGSPSTSKAVRVRPANSNPDRSGTAVTFPGSPSGSDAR